MPGALALAGVHAAIALGVGLGSGWGLMVKDVGFQLRYCGG